MRSDKQNESSRTNGRKSKGPKTDQGKANSAQNASTHNLVGQHFILLSTEDPEDFAIHEAGFLQRFQPIDSVEYDLVQKMIIAAWRDRRIAIMETSLFEVEMARQEAALDEEFSELGPGPRQVLALFGATDASAASALLLRYASAARRAFADAFRILRELQGDRFNRGSANTPFVPTHAPTQRQPHRPQEQQQQQDQQQAHPSASSGQQLAPATPAAPTRLQAEMRRLTQVSRHTIHLAMQPEIGKLQNEPETAHPSTATAEQHQHEGETHPAVFRAGMGAAAAA